jgi:hypothetical protein
MVKLKLELVFFGDLLNPLEFTNLIGILATNYWYKGDSIPDNNRVSRLETSWEYSTNFIETYYLDDVSKLLLDKFEPYTDKISEYIKSNKLESKLYVIAESESGNTPALFFDKKLVRFLSKIDGVIDVDLLYI